jgi:hypothetical protein
MTLNSVHVSYLLIVAFVALLIGASLGYWQTAANGVLYLQKLSLTQRNRRATNAAGMLTISTTCICYTTNMERICYHTMNGY